jgi:hypothetical protein
MVLSTAASSDYSPNAAVLTESGEDRGLDFDSFKKSCSRTEFKLELTHLMIQVTLDFFLFLFSRAILVFVMMISWIVVFSFVSSRLVVGFQIA